jgi:hypothetical protein
MSITRAHTYASSVEGKDALLDGQSASERKMHDGMHEIKDRRQPFAAFRRDSLISPKNLWIFRRSQNCGLLNFS